MTPPRSLSDAEILQRISELIEFEKAGDRYDSVISLMQVRDWLSGTFAARDNHIRCTCHVRSDAIGPHLRACPNHPESTK